MDLFGHHLSNVAMKFIDEYTSKLDKELKYCILPDNDPRFGAFEDTGKFYVIGICSNVPGKSFEATLCHELYHAYQFSSGFPTVISGRQNADDLNKFTENLRSNILDLSADDAVRKYGIDDSFVMNRRYKSLKILSSSRFSEINDQFKEDLLSIDLVLDFHSIKDSNKILILNSLREYLPDVYRRYCLYQDKVNEFGYETPEGCFKIMGFIINEMDLWSYCSILYKNKKVTKGSYRRNIIMQECD